MPAGSSTRAKAAVHGFKAHVGADAETALIEEVAVTPANVNDGKAGPKLCPTAPAKYSPTTRIAATILPMRFAPRAERHA
jgi:Transposase DDE domain